jgi:16S rRNA (cytosine1407-C5)-methyltransferase
MNDKLQKKKTLFLNRIAEIFAWSPDEAAAHLSVPLQSALRANSLRDFTIKDLEHLAKAEEWHLKPLEWSSDALLLETNKSAITHHPAFEEGKFYLQNPSSLLPVLALNPQPGEQVLDMAAAPGGKASYIAALTNNQAALTVNDNSRPRLARMRHNFERLQVTPIQTLLSTFERLPKHFEEASFDKILLDAPCSGEGLINLKKPKDFTYWSPAQIKRLSTQQKRAIRIAWRLLAPGGTLVYSTCTMAPEENEMVIDYLLKHEPEAHVRALSFTVPARWPALQSWHNKPFHPDVSRTLRIQPGTGFEAFYIATLYKQPE